MFNAIISAVSYNYDIISKNPTRCLHLSTSPLHFNGLASLQFFRTSTFIFVLPPDPLPSPVLPPILPLKSLPQPSLHHGFTPPPPSPSPLNLQTFLLFCQPINRLLRCFYHSVQSPYQCSTSNHRHHHYFTNPFTAFTILPPNLRLLSLFYHPTTILVLFYHLTHDHSFFTQPFYLITLPLNPLIHHLSITQCCGTQPTP